MQFVTRTYAFPQKREGKIWVSLKHISENLFSFSITDNDVGLYGEELKPKSTGFGSQLINLLVMQMEGKMQHTNQNDFSREIQFSIH